MVILDMIFIYHIWPELISCGSLFFTKKGKHVKEGVCNRRNERVAKLPLWGYDPLIYSHHCDHFHIGAQCGYLQLDIPCIPLSVSWYSYFLGC